MQVWSRIANVLRRRQVDRDIDEELQSHLEEARAAGRNPGERERAFGSRLRTHEAVRDAVMLPWLESLLSDAAFGWRQIRKHKGASMAAILSLALGIGSCMAAFRLVDALLLRSLPVASPERLHVLAVGYIDDTGQADFGYSSSYPNFRHLRETVKERAELIAIDSPQRINLTYGTDEEMERVSRQYVSGWTFSVFGLRPAVGRLFTEADDIKPGAHPNAVLSYDYWTRRFGRDRDIIGRSFRNGNDSFQIVGVTPEDFTGTEPGTVTDVFMPTMMNSSAIGNPDWNWLRTWVQIKPGVASAQVEQQLRAALLAQRRERVKSLPPGFPAQRVEQFLSAPVVLQSAASGISNMQREYRRSLVILGVLVGLVLLIACANVANLMTVQAASRAREMALRVSIGAGRARLLQLVIMESAWIAVLASAAGAAFAWWAAPFVAGMINPPDNPVRLIMPVDVRVTAFGVVLAFAVTVLFGLAPALRASAVKPASALKGGDDPKVHRRMMNLLVGAQVAFCVLVHLTAGLFVSTFERMANQPTGFSAERVLTLESVATSRQPAQAWYRVTDHLRSVPGVESAALSGWALMSGAGMNLDVWANGHSPDGSPSPWFLGVSPGWLGTMNIPLLDGRDFRSNDAFPDVAVVNQAFARRYFEGRNPVGRTFETQLGPNRATVRIVALTADARYTGMRGPIPATAYIPFRKMAADTEGKEDWATFVVRTRNQDPLSLVSSLRKAVPIAATGFRVANVRTQEELVRMHTIRERLLATLSLFFAAVALILGGVGLYGVLDYTVLERRRELGIRIALGARSSGIGWLVTSRILAMVVVGVTAGAALGIAAERYLFTTLLYEVKATDTAILVMPAITILAAALLAACPPVLRAIRIDPSKLLRSD